jgi:Oxidoreductase molybdopterin binding domain.
MIPFILAAFFLFLTACGDNQPDISAYKDMPITVSGLTEKDFEVTPAELEKLGSVSGSGTGSSDKAGTVDGYGPTLDSFLSEHGKKRDDFSKIRFTGKDEYTKTIWGEMLKKQEIIFSISDGKEPLQKSETPMRLLIPGAESSYWVYGVVKIEFIK